MLRGATEVNGAVTNGQAAAVELGVKNIQEESSARIGNNRRTGRGTIAETDRKSEAMFEDTHPHTVSIAIRTDVMGRKWNLCDKGDAIPGVNGDPTNDVFD